MCIFVGKKKMDCMKGKRFFLSGLLALSCLAASAAGTLRYGYKHNGITHISTDYERITLGENAFWTRVESVGFPDGSAAWLLYLDFEGKQSVNVPKGVKMAATLAGGKLLRLEQIGTDVATKRAFQRGKEHYYLNRTKYMAEPGEMTRLCAGVKSLDVVTGWDPDDYIQVSFPGDEWAKLLSAHVAAIEAAPAPEDLSGEVARYADSNNSLLVAAKPEVVKGGTMLYNVGLTYLYYKTNGNEDFDLSLQLGTDRQYSIPVESEVAFLLGDGTKVSLRQTREVPNSLFLYPSVADVRRMIAAGVSRIDIQTESGTVSDTFSARALSDALNRQYQLLMSVSPK